MTDQLPDRLAAELAVCEGTTEGPWRWDNAGDPYVDSPSAGEDVAVNVWSQHDAEFIATARTALPTALRALQAVMELHSQTFDTPWRRAHPGQPGCSECVDQLDGPAFWPCPTIKAIQEVYGDELHP